MRVHFDAYMHELGVDIDRGRPPDDRDCFGARRSQQRTLAIAVATSIATILATPAAVYSAFMFVTAGAFARLMWARNGLKVVEEPLVAEAQPLAQ